MSAHRTPYVGDGADGARRSAQIDREEADLLPLLDPRIDELLESASRWDQQASELDGADPNTTIRTIAANAGLTPEELRTRLDLLIDEPGVDQPLRPRVAAIYELALGFIHSGAHA